MTVKKTVRLEYTEAASEIFYWEGNVLLGTIKISCGILSTIVPAMSTLTQSMLIAVTALVVGIMHIVLSFGSERVSGVMLNAFLGVIYLAGGIAFLIWPFAGARFLTMILSWTLLAAGVTQIGIGFAVGTRKRWRSMLLSGALSTALGLWLMLRFNVASLFVPGLAWGIALLSEGSANLARALGKRRPALDVAVQIAEP
jgi:uncharacterized membrane protein HdeD (DUF308 family)